LAVGCSSGAPAGSVNAGGLPLDSGAQVIGAGPLPLEGGASIRSLPFSTNDLVFDPKRGVLYATMNPYGVRPTGEIFDAGADAGNSVITIDPVSATVTGSLFVGSSPNVLAISDDGSSLYVGIDGAHSVCRVDLASMTVGPLLSLLQNDPSLATQIAAVPGSSTQYVVSRSRKLGFPGLSLYDGDALLTAVDGLSAGDSITFTDPSTLFGYSNFSPSNLLPYSVRPPVITPGQVVTGLITPLSTVGVDEVQITSNGGWIFALNGQTVSAATMTVVGTYNATIAQTSRGPEIDPVAVLPDADGANVWFLRPDPVLLDFDRTTFLLRRSISLDPVSADVGLGTGNARALVRWSPTGLAFRTFSAVYLVTVPN
jgi:hypothetical protein